MNVAGDATAICECCIGRAARHLVQVVPGASLVLASIIGFFHQAPLLLVLL
jgi:hypothetical protein